MQTQAQRIHKYGGPEVIVLEVVDLPRPGPQEALIRVKAAGVGPWDALVRNGTSGVESTLPLTLGSDVAGFVVDIGIGVTHLAAGVEVYGATNALFTGGYARHAIVDAKRVARKPAIVDFVQAASLPVVAVTAWTMVFERAGLQRGKHVLVHGAGGSVGALVVQMALATGAVVTAFGRFADGDYLRSLGADVVGDYGAGPFENSVGRADVVIDTIGGDIQRRSFAVLKSGGILVSSVSRPSLELAAQYHVRGDYFLVDVNEHSLERVSTMLIDKTIIPNVGRVLPLAEARKAHELLAAPPPRVRGKIVLTT